MKLFFIAFLIFISGCSTTLNHADDCERMVSTTVSGQVVGKLSEKVPVLKISQAEMDSLIDMKWSDSLSVRMKESGIDENLKRKAIIDITVAGIGPLQCTSEEFSLVRVEKGIDGEVWVVDVCGEKRCIFDRRGILHKMGSVSFDII